QRLATAWIEARDPQDAGRQLLPLLAPLGFPAFTQRVIQSKTQATSVVTPTTPTVSEPTRPQTVPSELTQILASIDRWLAGDPLSEDGEPRALLFELIRESIPWQDITRIPARERQALLADK